MGQNARKSCTRHNRRRFPRPLTAVSQYPRPVAHSVARKNAPELFLGTHPGLAHRLEHGLYHHLRLVLMNEMAGVFLAKDLWQRVAARVSAAELGGQAAAGLARALGA